MNFIESEILKGKYFVANSRDRLRATMVNLFMFVGAFIILLYAYDNLEHRYYIMMIVELLIVLTLTSAYLLFPHYVSITTASYMVFGAFTFLLSISFVVPDRYPELSLFWLASLPIFVFFFLGVNRGIRWSGYMFVILLIIPLTSYIMDIKFVYDWELLSQILFGYLVVSYMLYIIEKERSSYEQRLSVALEENEMLFKEVHHRTKNNMQVIMGLLETQSFKIDNLKYKKMFEAHVDRLKAMSLIHKNLYTNNLYSEVDIGVYLNDIAKSLRSYTHHNIYLDIDNIRVDMKSAMNIGLIFNEAVTNSIEHAFMEDETGDIEVKLKATDMHYILTISDNGRGFDATKKYSSLGMTLIEDLSSTLYNSSFEIDTKNGVTILISFELKEDR